MNLCFRKSCRWTVLLALLLACVPGLFAQPGAAAPTRWSEAQANAWYAQQPWPVGANFLPSTACLLYTSRCV